MPYNAGHSLGGTIWRISKDQEEFVYAVDYNHKSEKYGPVAPLAAVAVSCSVSSCAPLLAGAVAHAQLSADAQSPCLPP